MTGTANPPMMPPRAGRYSRLTSSPVPEPTRETYSVDQAIDYIGLGTFQYVVLALAGLCWTAESMEMLLLSFIKQPLQCNWRITDSQAAFITTSVAIGMLAGSTAWGVFADRYGRRTSFIVSTAFLAGMGLLSAVSVNYTMLVVARGLVGFGVGGVPVSFSLLMEFLPSAQRGSWGMSLSLFWALGAMFESCVAMIILPKYGWRWLIFASSLPLLFVLLLSVCLSESPRWLAARGKYDRVLHTLERIARINRAKLPPGRLDINTIRSAEESSALRRLESAERRNNEQFSVRDALISAQLTPTRADYAASVDIASDAAAGATGGTVADHLRRAENVPNPENSEDDSPPPAPTPKKGIKALLIRGARSLALQIAIIWLVCAFVYYGLILLQPELIIAENEGKRCNYARNECALADTSALCEKEPICSWTSDGGCIPTGIYHSHESEQPDPLKGVCGRQLTREDYIATLWASSGEMPGIIFAFILVDVIGRRPLLGYMFGCLGLAFFLLLFCVSRLLETAIFFIARGASSGAFQAMYLVTNEIYPASIRATAMGIASSIARIGLFITPFIAQYLLNINQTSALISYFISALLSIMCILMLPIETTGRPLVSSMDELVQAMREARLRGNDIGPTFAKDPSVHPIVRFFRWNALLDDLLFEMSGFSCAVWGYWTVSLGRSIKENKFAWKVGNFYVFLMLNSYSVEICSSIAWFICTLFGLLVGSTLYRRNFEIAPT